MAVRTILVTGAGAPGIRGTLYALRDGLAGARAVGVDVSDEAVGRWLCDAFEAVPPPEDAGYVDAMLAVCRAHGVDAVLPQTTRELPVLARHRARFEAEGVAVVVADEAAIERANSKTGVLEAFEALGLPAPAWRVARTEDELAAAAAALGYPERPVVVKPPVSNGMRGLRVLKEKAWDAARFLAEKPSGTEIALAELTQVLRRGAWPALVVSEYLPGPEYTVDAFIGAEAEAAVVRRRDRIRSGITFAATVLPDSELAAWTLRAGRHLGLRYCFGFQFKEDAAGVPRVLECNPRVQGTMVAAGFAGANVIAMAVREALGEPVASVPPLRPARFLRYWGGVGVTDEGGDVV